MERRSLTPGRVPDQKMPRSTSRQVPEGLPSIMRGSENIPIRLFRQQIGRKVPRLGGVAATADFSALFGPYFFKVVTFLLSLSPDRAEIGQNRPHSRQSTRYSVQRRRRGLGNFSQGTRARPQIRPIWGQYGHPRQSEATLVLCGEVAATWGRRGCKSE